MQKFKNLNNISDELMSEIPLLKSGEEVVFQMLNGHPNNDMDRTEREKQPFLYGKTQIPTKVRIKDPHTNKIVDIGVPQAIENDEVKSFKPFLAGKDDGGIFNGKFSLMGGRIEDEELFEVFWLTEKYGDASQQKLFKIVNQKEETNKTLTKVDILRKALDILKDMKQIDIETFAASQNWTETDPDTLKGKVSEFAKSFPDKFNAIQGDPKTKTKAIIKKAIDANIITVDHITKKVTVNGNDIMSIAKDNPDYIGAIASWIDSAKNGKDVLDGVVKLLDKGK